MVRNVRLARDVEAHLHRRPATSHGERRSVTPVRSRTRSSSFNAPDYPRADLGVKKATAHEARSSSEIEGIEDDYTTADTLERLRIPAIEAAQQRLKEMHSPSPTFLAAMHDPFRSSSESIGPSIGSGNDEPSSSAGQHLSDIDLSLRRSTSEFDMQKIKRARELAHAFRAKEQGRNSSLSPSRRLARQSMHDLSTRAVSGVESPEGTLSHVQRRRLSKAMPLLLTQKAPLHPLPSLPPVPPGESISGRHVDETSSHPLNRQLSSNTARFEPSNEILANVGTGRSGEDDAPRYPRSAKSSSSVEPFTGPPTVSSHGGADDVEAVLEAASGPVWPHSFDSHATDHRRVTFAVEDQGRDNSVVSGSSDSIQTTLDKNRSNDTSSAQDHHGSHDQVCAPSLDLTPLKTMTRADLVYRRSSAALRSRNSSGGLSTTTTAAMTGITSTTTEHKRVRHASIASHRSMDGVSLLFLRSQAYPPPSPSSSSFRSIPRRASNPVLRKPLLLPLRQTPSPTGRAFEGRCASSSPDGSGPSSASLHR
ncbi:unnamed protein product [Tilletia controversa]|nr:unnamed protein product [Tilletia caries]CAD6912332.1 unnamed protein product [Tilletia controversa]CAD6939083.1 unnamed protein product [Tilletia laevis]CAD6931129.1 unnamed protein product [Tilletia caries]CAD6941274.1 unnamed protein product [Tilletia laevis]